MVGVAKQEGSNVVVYDEKGNYLFTRNGELAGFTSTTVAIKEGSNVAVYDEKGNYLFQK